MPLTEQERMERFQLALNHGGPSHRISDVRNLIDQGKAQWWSNGDGMIVTTIDDHPLFRSVHFWLIAGVKSACLALEHEILPWAIEEAGCTVATATGRRGWGRVAAPTGWRPHGCTFYKPLVGSDLWHRGGTT